MITIYTIAWNEEFMLPFFIAHYRMCFPGCKIIVYDNESTDRTREVAEEGGCEVRTFKTGNTLSDRTYLEIKNNCWKDAATDWVLICDVDEHCEVTTGDLAKEFVSCVSVLRFKGFNMIGTSEEIESPFQIKQGVRAESYDKLYLFNRTKIQEINYRYGCHNAHPIGEAKYSSKFYTCRHYKYLNLSYMIRRHSEFSKRLSDHNKKHGLGAHYLYTPEEITKEFNSVRERAYVI